jgi:hypothetical protein
MRVRMSSLPTAEHLTLPRHVGPATENVFRFWPRRVVETGNGGFDIDFAFRSILLAYTIILP